MFLPDNEYTFYCKVQGDKTQQWFEGDFTVKCILTQAEMVDVAIRTDRYAGGAKSLPQQHALINRSIAELEVRVKLNKEGKPMCPTWWTDSQFGREIYDTNVIYYVFSEAMKAEEVWDKKLREKADKAEKKEDKK